MHFQLKKTITQVTVLSALIPVAACTGGQVKTQRNPELAPQQVTSLRDPDLAPKRGQYSYDTVEGHVVRTTVTGECVQTIYWTPDGATQECHPSLFGKAAAPAPKAAEAPPPKAAAAPPPKAAEAPPQAPVEYEAMQYSEATEYEAAPYETPPAAAAEAPMEDFYAPGDAPDLVPVPPPSAEAGPDDRIGEPKMYYEEEEVAAAEEGIVGGSRYYEEEGVVAEEGIVGRSQYYEEEEQGAQRDDGIVSRNEYFEEEESVQQDDGIVSRNEYFEEEEGVQKDDGIVGQSQYYEEEAGAQKDEGIVAQEQYYEEEAGAQKDEGIVAQEQYYEEEAGAQKDEGIVAQEQYYEEEGKQPEDLISEPKTPQEAPVAAAEEEKQAAPVVAAAEQEKPAVEAVAAAEQEKPAAPEKEPSPVMLPVTITLEAEPWFDFDRYAVRSDARDKLDKLVGEMTGVEFDQILVVGHADPIGTPPYNQVLSERRARSVKNYLVGKGLPAERIKTEGRGEFEPALDPAFCKGQRGKKLIGCLQPDRRVEVTVTGTKLQK